MRSWLRSVVLIAVTLAVWLVVKPAAAAAPLCDERGATTFAPPPTLDAPTESIDVGDGTDACAWLTLDRDAAYSEHTGGEARQLAARSDVTVHAPPAFVPPAQGVIVPIAADETAHPVGVRARLERPPRGA
jgi:hypothetical protein